MAGGSSDPALVERLGQAHRSRRLVLLRAVLERVEDLDEATGSLPSLGDSWALLAAVQRRNSVAVESVLTLPRTTVWAREVLKLLDGTPDPERPMWTIIGYFHQVVAAAAVRAGHDLEWSVPLWRGTVLLPSLGLAEVPGDTVWSVGEFRYTNGRAVIHGSEGSTALPGDLTSEVPGWSPMRTVRMGDREVWLDDLDPHREFGAPLPPRRLPAHEVVRWADQLREMWRLLSEHHPAIAGELAEGLSTLVPYSETDQTRPYSASHNDAFGSVVLSRPPDATTFAELLVHEFGHSKFGVLLSLVDLLDPDGDNETPFLYAPWRDDPRPAVGVLHGVYSFLGVTAFYRVHRAVVTGAAARSAQFEFEFHRIQTFNGVDGLLSAAALTDLGRDFLGVALGRLQAWATEPLHADVRDAAYWVNADNRLSWRMRQLQPDAAAVTALAEAWLAGATKPAVATDTRLVPVTGAVPKPRLTLIRTWLSTPERAEHYRAAPDLLAEETGGATMADLALLEGDAERASELFRHRLLDRPGSPADWAGLALACGEKALLVHPELVFRVHEEVRARTGEHADPIELTRWLS